MKKIDESYFNYLQKRSRLGYLYRKFWLYPKLCRYLGEKTLDVGCGIGDLLQYKKNIIGVDINSESVKYCQSKGLNARLMKIDILPFKSNVFNSIVLDNVLEHIENPELLLHEVRRVLIDNGTILVGVPGIKGFSSDPDHKVFYSESKLIDVLAVNGFTLDLMFNMPFKWKYLDTRASQYCVYAIFKKTIY
jgi:ubiquinone/menaquinone biosynthesis C-methylase UbiE